MGLEDAGVFDNVDTGLAGLGGGLGRVVANVSDTDDLVAQAQGEGDLGTAGKEGAYLHRALPRCSGTAFPMELPHYSPAGHAVPTRPVTY